MHQYFSKNCLLSFTLLDSRNLSEFLALVKHLALLRLDLSWSGRKIGKAWYKAWCTVNDQHPAFLVVLSSDLVVLVCNKREFNGGGSSCSKPVLEGPSGHLYRDQQDVLHMSVLSACST